MCVLCSVVKCEKCSFPSYSFYVFTRGFIKCLGSSLVSLIVFSDLSLLFC